MYEPPPPPKYVMINESNGLRPPPQRRNLPRYHSQPRKSRGHCCLKCICCCYCFLFILIIALAIAVYVLYETFKHDVPKYKVQQFNVAAFNLLPDFSLSTELNVVIRAENPSDVISLKYGKGSSVTLNYMDKVICSGKVPEFYQDHNSVKNVDVPLKGKMKLTSKLQESLADDKKEGKIPLLIIVKAPLIIELGRIPLQEVIINVNITMVVDRLETGKKISILSSTYEYAVI